MFGAPVTRAALLSQPVISPLTILSFDCAVWYDNQDLSTMHADYIGTPASIGSAVAVQFDKKFSGQAGSELRQTGAIAMTGTTTPATYNTSTGVGTSFRTDGANVSYVNIAGITVGRPYSVDIEATGANSVIVTNGGTTIATLTAGQRKTVFVPAITSSLQVGGSTNGVTTNFTVHSVTEVLGTPRYQTTAAQRPILGRHPKGGRRNLLTYTEDFSNAAWGVTNAGVGSVPTKTINYATAPDGTQTACRIQCSLNGGTTASDQSLMAGSATTTSAARGSWYVKTNDGTSKTVYFRGAAATTITVTGTWQRVDFSAGTLSGTQFGIGLRGGQSTPCSNTADILVWHPQLEVGSAATAYQKVGSTYDCTETGVPDCYFLQADGVDDGMVTPELNLTATDKIGVFAAARKLSDVTRGMIVEFNNGGFNSFRLEGPANIGDIEYAFSSTGSSTGFAGYDNAEGAAPNTAILTGIGNIAGDSAILRKNGVQVSSAANDQGTGNYGNYPLYFFRRGGTTLPFNGLEYGNVISIAPTLGQAAAMETYRNNIVGAY